MVAQLRLAAQLQWGRIMRGGGGNRSDRAGVFFPRAWFNQVGAG